MKNSRSTYIPTRDEVRRACQKIQRGWTTTERNKRLVTRLPGWLPPLIRTQELGMAAPVSEN